MTTLPPAAIGTAYTDATAWTVLTALADLDDRMPGHEGEAAAATILEDAFDDAGLGSVSTTAFPIRGWWREGASLTVTHEKRSSTFDGSHELVELPGTPAGTVTGDIIDMGAGLPEDFDGVDLTGRLAMASSRTPDTYGRWVHRTEKYAHAVEAGAAGFLFYNHIEGALPPTGDVGRADKAGPIPAVGLSKELGVRLARHCAASADGGVDATLAVDARTEPATSVTVEATVGPDTEEEVVCTAHLDAHDIGVGANDNGFGAALTVGIGRLLAAIEPALETKVRLVVFGAEEIGLCGSHHWCHTHDLSRLKCVFNLDAIGYSRTLEVHPHGIDEVRVAFEEVGTEFDVPINIEEGVVPHSDHWPFLQRGVAASYGQSVAADSGRGWGHTHGDTLDKLDARDLRDLTVLCTAGLVKLAEADRTVERRTPESVRDELVEAGLDSGMKATNTWPWGPDRPWPWVTDS